jgi:hypothetical protein
MLGATANHCRAIVFAWFKKSPEAVNASGLFLGMAAY